MFGGSQRKSYASSKACVVSSGSTASPLTNARSPRVSITIDPNLLSQTYRLGCAETPGATTSGADTNSTAAFTRPSRNVKASATPAPAMREEAAAGQSSHADGFAYWLL